MSLWTPGGEHPVDKGGSQPPTAPPPGEPEMTPEQEAEARQIAEQMAQVREQLSQVPDGLLAECLGAILMRPDFGNEAAKLQVVRALGKVAGPEATQALADYVSATPEKPPRQSRREAEAMVESRLEGGE